MPFSLPDMDNGQNETVSDWIITMKSGPNYGQCQFSAGRYRNQLQTDQSLCSFFAWRDKTRKKSDTGQWSFFQAITHCLKVLPFFFYLKVGDDATDSVTCLTPLFSRHSSHNIFTPLQRLFGSSEEHLWCLWCPGMRMDFKTTTL